MSYLKLLAVSVLGLTLIACGGNATKEASKDMSKANPDNSDLYEVEHEGRHYVFDDFAIYQSFLEVGETSYRKVYIGEGPKGSTLVFGLTGEDKKKTSGIASIDMYNGELAPADDFYGEMRLEHRIYVFDSLDEMEAVRTTGEAPYRFTKIGVGPKGETVVFVLTSDKKKEQPVELVAEFKKRNGLM